MRKSILYSTTAIVVVFAVYLLLFRDRNRIVAFSPPATVPVEGTVLVGGKPKAGVRVSYHPQFDIGRVKFTPIGSTDQKGRFTLSSKNPGDGAPPGEYIVTFDYPVLSTGGIEEDIDFFKGKYSDPAKSQWKVKVQKDSQETFHLD